MLLTTTNVSKKYSNKTIIKNINLQISEGDIIGLVGGMAQVNQLY